MLPIDSDNFPLFIPVASSDKQRISMVLKTPHWRYVFVFEEFARAESVILTYQQKESFGVGVVEDATTLLLWLKSARDQGANQVLWNPRLADIADGKTLEPEGRGTLVEAIKLTSELVAGMVEGN